MKKKILICEDDNSIQKLLQYNLEKNNYQVNLSDSAEEAKTLLDNNPFDLVILDIMLPGMDGLEFCKIVQEEYKTPVIFLSAKDDEIDKVVGLELGADDYITKPFSVRELLARVKAVLRRVEKSTQLKKSEDKLEIGNLEINSLSRKVYINKEEIEFTSLEFDLLLYLAKNKGIALHRHEIMDKVWGTDFIGDTRIIDVHISHIRDKLAIKDDEQGYIETVRSIGYRMK
jgi:two-component system alkaline phosphatase synthesis response regulator PhoP